MDLASSISGALAQPTRARLFARLGELRRSAGTDELAAHLGLHPNGVRTHLEVLHGAGLVIRERTRQARGRPRDMWSIAPEAQPNAAPPRAYLDLARWLAGAITSGQRRLREIKRTGRELGRQLAPTDSTGPPETTMHNVLSSLGFQPRRQLDHSGTLTYRLCNCPYREVAREHQEVVCTLHHGMAQGLLDAIDPATRLAAFLPKEPDTAGCLITLRGPLADDAQCQE